MATNEPTPALSSDMNNSHPDGRVMSPDEIRAELRRINKTLKLSAIQKKEPYECLPYQYRPMPDLDHRPPVFMYGLALNPKEIEEYIRRPDTAILSETIDVDWTSLLVIFVRHLRELFGLENAVFPWYLSECDDRLVFELVTNYDRRGVTEAKIAEFISTCKRLFGRPPMWYLVPFLKLKKDYCIPESKYFD